MVELVKQSPQLDIASRRAEIADVYTCELVNKSGEHDCSSPTKLENANYLRLHIVSTQLLGNTVRLGSARQVALDFSAAGTHIGCSTPIPLLWRPPLTRLRFNRGRYSTRVVACEDSP